ncbi:hypothetical protein E3O42_09625 [Cryobacterium adonitolivorans]|uniref:Uncharacterized protein n=1 Tax=Cryobacterium adonitolivorans TaxID=1259189 RepID=A0A4R8W3A6_9MICO|nr:hypothetical protein [Cryobacterium adonitolivorans]TFC01624.1 hypothetical protein E3O42_09625 [Cryobacterium adonitolivorans]
MTATVRFQRPCTAARWHQRRIDSATHAPGRGASILSRRQDLPVLASTDLTAAGVTAGVYLRWKHGDGGDLATIATGSEVHPGHRRRHPARRGRSQRLLSGGNLRGYKM